ncbi:threonine aspartase 1-like protein [Pilaira anomala]|nr:threonine aspartase 1-like protein [Pilaira anomala]
MSEPVFIAVHVGAGNLARSKETKYRSACALACEVGMKILKRENGRAAEAVAMAIAQLENDPITNAGYGSNLTLKGTVECDASLMTGESNTFAAVGAVSGIKNPILTTHIMIKSAEKGLLSLGRIPPMFLVGDGAKIWAKERGQTIVEPQDLITQNAQDVYLDHLQRLIQDEQERTDLGHDTVGAICVDQYGHIAAGVSSGGISLKAPGRVGEAAMYGSGCWAQNENEDLPGVACSTTGTGEQIMKTMFTYKCAERISNQQDIQTAIQDTLIKDFLESPFLKMYDIKSVGTIALRKQKSNQSTRIEFWYGHVTADMGIGYMTGTSKKPKVKICILSTHEYIVYLF